MKKLVFLFVLGAMVACNTQEADAGVTDADAPTLNEGVEVEVESIEVTDSTLILKIEATEPDAEESAPEEPVAE
jgi:hypothetical protein